MDRHHEWAIIAAVNEQGIIGVDGKIPWHCRDDMRHFARKTTGNAVIMGRKTFESMGEKSLKNRLNVVMSETMKRHCHDAFIARTFTDAINCALVRAYNSIYIIGGSAIYREAMTSMLGGGFRIAYITLIKHRFADEELAQFKEVTYFPMDELNNWRCVSEVSLPTSPHNVVRTFIR